MTLTLYLIRHAKSDWDDPLMEDFDRPLNDRGRQSASALGNWIANQPVQPEEVLCSAAARTQETWARIAPALPATPVKMMQALYHSGPLTLFEALHGATSPTVAMIAHNPGIAEFAEMLTDQPPADRRFFQYPTGATTVFTFEGTDWSDVAPGQGTITDFVVPRDLI